MPLIGQPTERDLEKECPGFVRPYRVVELYLEKLGVLGMLRKVQGEWCISSTFASEWLQQRAVIKEITRLREALQEDAEAILAQIPEDEKQGFSLERWLRAPQGMTLEEAVGSVGRVDLESTLRQLKIMILSRGGIVDDLMGLPLRAARERCIDAKHHRDEERHRKAQEAAQLAADERVRGIENFARSTLGLAAEDWLTRPNRQLAGKTPRECANENERGQAQAERAGVSYAANLQELKRKEESAERWRQRLIQSVPSRLPDAYVRLFLTSVSRGLGNARPLDYCVNEFAFTRCLEAADAFAREIWKR
jgi:hypothetical protein